MAFNFLTVILKNFRSMYNSKLSSLIVILGPVILILITGLALSDNSLRNINSQVFIDSPSSFSNNVILGLKQKSFNVLVVDSLDSCKSSVISGDSHVCIGIFRDSDKGLIIPDYGDIGYHLELFVDFSKQRTVWGVINTIQTAVDVESDKIRDSAVSNLRVKLDELVLELETKRLLILEAQGQLAYLKVLSDGTIDDYNNAVSSLSVVSLNIGTLKSSLRDLKTVGVDYDRINSLLYYLDNIENANEAANSNIDKIFSKEGLEDIGNNIDVLINDLSVVQSSMFNLISELKQLRDVNLDRVSNPIPLTYSSVKGGVSSGTSDSQDLEFLDYLFPSFLMFFILFASLIFSTLNVFRERSSPAHIRNITSKTSGVSFILGNFVTSVIIISLQVSLIVLLAARFLNFSILSVMGSFVITLALSVSLFSLIGMFIGYLFDSQEGAIIASVSLALLFLVFMPIITPTETLPGVISSVVSLSPLVILESKLRIASIFGYSFVLSVKETISLISSFIVSSVLLVVVYHYSKRREI
ncbi:hypothetical protein COU61_03730 [Candidatus Pacearchaeota archaeon CG10_big_fil_rev_8_21_14_0_10_35_13]|nr:MAG: hypothetical protein COU61_03730 [Candidatus Pacearchaeota archaeon CG10_big_fil_rev_8_21_14_0_10_35_13]